MALPVPHALCRVSVDIFAIDVRVEYEYALVNLTYSEKCRGGKDIGGHASHRDFGAWDQAQTKFERDQRRENTFLLSLNRFSGMTVGLNSKFNHLFGERSIVQLGS
jgi:hypothetical protein